jgi:hypothetical protein
LRSTFINQQKDIANDKYKEGQFQEAIDIYIKAYCGIAGFKIEKKTEKEDLESIDKDLKSPLLNNIAMCLIKLGKL